MAGNQNSGPRPGARAHRDDAVLNLHEQDAHIEAIERGFDALAKWLVHAQRRAAACRALNHQSVAGLVAAQEIDDARREIAAMHWPVAA